MFPDLGASTLWSTVRKSDGEHCRKNNLNKKYKNMNPTKRKYVNQSI